MALGWHKPLRPLWRFIVAMLLSAFSFATELPSNQIKAAYLYQISKFVFWPDEMKAQPSFNVCQFGADTFEGSLSKMQGRQVFSKPITLKTVSTFQQSVDCHLLILSHPAKIKLKELRQWLQKNPVLTVVNGADFIQLGMVAFVQEQQRIRLHINLNLAQEAQLSFAANLLEVASKIYREEKE